MSQRVRAFTFIEIMFVVVIIGLLATMVTTTIIGKGQIVRERTTRTNMATINTALQTFELDYGRFPTSQEGLEVLLENKRINQPGYINEPYLPRDGWKQRFQYRAPGEYRIFYDLWSVGPDGQDGTDDDLTNWKDYAAVDSGVP